MKLDLPGKKYKIITSNFLKNQPKNLKIPQEVGPARIKPQPICKVTSHIFISYKFYAKNTLKNKLKQRAVK